jgi:hypothetical protein
MWQLARPAELLDLHPEPFNQLTYQPSIMIMEAHLC